MLSYWQGGSQLWPFTHSHSSARQCVCECVRVWGWQQVLISHLLFSLLLCVFCLRGTPHVVCSHGGSTRVCVFVCVCVSKQQVSRAYCALMIIFLFIFMLPKYNFGSRYYITVYLALDKFLLFSSCCSSYSAVFVFVFFFLLRCPQRLMACGILTYGCLILIGLSMPHSKLLFSIFCLVAFWTCPNSNLPATAANRLHRKFFALPYVFQFASGSTSWNIAKSSSLEYGKVSWKVIWLPRMWNLLRAWWVCQINKIIKRYSIFLQVKLNYLCYLLESPLWAYFLEMSRWWEDKPINFSARLCELIVNGISSEIFPGCLWYSPHLLSSVLGGP